MSDPAKTRLVLDDFSGGRNGADSPLGPNFGATQVVDAVNGDWFRTTGFRKRWGSSALSMSGFAGTGGAVWWLGRHVPGTLDADAELWALGAETGLGGPPAFNRLDNSVTWTAPTAADAVSATAADWVYPAVTHASLNGLLFLSYKSAVNRLHVYDPATGTIRRTGIDPGTTAPTAANTAVGGAYPAIIRYYRVRFENNGLTRFSEATPSVSFTPSGAFTGVVVTRPTAPGEGETFWRLEASADNVTFYLLAEIAMATTTYTDTTPVANYALGQVSLLTGTFTRQKSYRFIAADQNRLIGWGSWTATDKQHRLEISAIVGSLDRNDAERVDTNTNYYIDFDELDSGAPTALVGPVWDRFYAFKTRQMFELIPTGSIDQPYRRIKISGELGCVGPHAACRGEDADGAPCLYILTHRGVYRYGLNGFQCLSRGIEDLILGPTSRINMNATQSIGHLVFYPDLNQLWVWFSVGTENYPLTTLCVYDVAANEHRGGWSRVLTQGEVSPIYTPAHAACSEMFADSIGATMGFSLVPYIGFDAGTGVLITKAADRTATTDTNGNAFQAYVTTRPLQVPGFKIATGDVQVLAPAAAGVTLSCTAIPDFGLTPTVTGTALLTASAANETRVTRPFTGSALAGSEFTQLTIGDAAAVSNAWSVDRIVVPIEPQDPVSG
jgi:hypothetical protein